MRTSRCRRRCAACRSRSACCASTARSATRRRSRSISPSASGSLASPSSTRWSANTRSNREQSVVAKHSTPVLIVGAGPVGLALAGDLGWRGVRCTLIEKTDGAIKQPKMDLVGVRTMEFCRRWGIADWVRDAPYPGDYPQDYIWLTALNGFELGREKFPGRAFEACPAESPQKRERVPQDMFDPILKRFAISFPHVGLVYNSELLSFEQAADVVRASVSDSRTGAVRTITA